MRGYVNPAGFDEAGLGVEEVPTDLPNLLKLARHRIDLVLIDKKLARYLIGRELPECTDRLEWMEPGLEHKMQYLCITKARDNGSILMEAFNQGLRLLRESGE